MTIKPVAFASVGLAGLILASCGSIGTLTNERTVPDEFRVVTLAPLTVPPEYSLRPPTPGEPRPQELQPDSSARAALLGRRAAAQRTPAEAAFASRAGADQADPLIRFVLAIQPQTREARSQWEERVQGPTDAAAERLAAARFAVYGDRVYPDATGTLRVTYGRLEGWTHEGVTRPYATTFAGLWRRATGAPPFQVPPRLAAARQRIPETTPYNVVASTDTIGGSSGSPAIDAQGRLIGANFDSTFLTQRNAYGYDRRVNRSVLVTAAAVDAALRQAYGMERLADELARGAAAARGG